LDSYLRTFFAILFTPWRAGRGLVVPDHWSRCVRWTVVHVMIAAFACVAMADDRFNIRWLAEQLSPSSSFSPDSDVSLRAPAVRMLVWFSQSLAAWSIVMLFAIGLGALLSISVPGRRRAAKLGGVKWSLYLSSIFVVVIAAWYVVVLSAWYGYYVLNPPQAPATDWWRFCAARTVPDPSPGLLTGVYGLWWAVGMAANRYNHKRGFLAFVGFALLFAGSWAILVRVMPSAGPLEALL
jgi:hypothetical protein